MPWTPGPGPTEGPDEFIGTAAGEAVNGAGGNDVLRGGGGNDGLFGGAGNDTIEGGDGDEINLDGQTGDDTIDAGAGNDLLTTFSGDDVLNGGVGGDRLALRYEDLTTAITMSVLTGSLATGYAGVFTDGTTAFRATFSGIERFGILGGSGNDVFALGDGNDEIDGRGGDDILNGGGGDDDLDGGVGNDTLIGGAGNDYFPSVGQGDSVDGGPGDDDIGILGGDLFPQLGSGTPASIQGGAGIDLIRLGNVTLSGFSAANGFERRTGGAVFGTDAANTLDFSSLTPQAPNQNLLVYGGAGNDTLIGGPGTEFLQGNAGADILDGGGGVDLADFDDTTVAVVLTLNGAVNATAFVGGVAEDTVRNVEAVRGGDAGDTLFGDALVNIFVGGDGADILRGGGGADTIDGEAGADFVDFRDKTAFQPVVLTLAGAADATAFVSGVAEDVVRNVENVYGGQGSDRLFGDAAGNAMFAANGNDVMRGGGGTDYLYGDAGIDQADYGDKAVPISVTLAGAAAAAVRVGGVVEDYLRGIEIIYGGSAADTLIGDGGTNLFRGGGGADVIDGAGGVDSVDFRDMTTAVLLTLNGATYATATIGGAPGDRVRNVEIVYAGSANDVLVGDGFANQLFGGAGVDTLRGGVGADVLTGGAGIDVFVYNAVGESTVALAGRDTIVDFVAGTDDIRLSLIDANTTAAAPGDQAFALGALAAGQAGRLAVTADGPGRWLVQGDVNGDGAADFAISVIGPVAPGAGDFVL